LVVAKSRRCARSRTAEHTIQASARETTERVTAFVKAVRDRIG
jgi:hypothetical protein